MTDPIAKHDAGKNIDKLKDVNKKIADLSSNLSKFKAGVDKILSKFGEKIRTYDSKNMLAMEERHGELSARLQLLIEKITVMTEIGYSVRNSEGITSHARGIILAATIWALDQPDAFWVGMSDKTIPDAAKKCMNAYKQAQLDCVMTKDEKDLRH